MSVDVTIPTPAPSLALPAAPPLETSLRAKLEAFCLQHASHNRPIVLVSSGGTVADLEARTVRSLDNFSTGLRGALSVEQFLERGYAVVHLWRIGSTSPYGRVAAEALGLQGNQGISAAALNRLLEHDDGNDDDNDDADEDQQQKMVATVAEEDPWMADDATRPEAPRGPNKGDTHAVSLQLHRRLSNNEHLQRAWRQWRSSKSRIITIPFRTVEEYLLRLKECASILDWSKSLCMFYLAAAVSDYYVPNKTEHKIQSSSDELVLRLQPVPKIMGTLRTHWAPEAFVVSFKLETDITILRQKAERAVSKYGVHMVVGNILDTRHDKVQVLYGDTEAPVQHWTMKVIAKSSSSPCLEEELIEFCVQQHFSFISQNFKTGNAAVVTHERLMTRKKALQKQAYWNGVRETAIQIGGNVLGLAITYVVSKAIQRRLGGH
jgi:phosphopantothenate---cysteine ligase (ATP)